MTSENALRARRGATRAHAGDGHHRDEGGAGSGLRATVKFRMPATDFIRLRLASRAMRETCQTIINDAIVAYLDANEVEFVDEETARREATRLSRSQRTG